MTLHDRLKPVPDEDLPSGRGWNAVVLGVALAVLAAGFALAMPYAVRPVTREVQPTTRLKPSPHASNPLILPTPTLPAGAGEPDGSGDDRAAKEKAKPRGKSQRHRRKDARSKATARKREPARSNENDDEAAVAEEDGDKPAGPPPKDRPDKSNRGANDAGDDSDDHRGKGHDDEDSATGD